MNHPIDYMQQALELAYQGLTTTKPNPRVGCVIVNNGVVVGKGFHEKAGYAHAEINALEQAGSQARGATLYVTLEPCCHFGKTPPCVDAIIAAGVKHVVAAMCDPNPQVAGNGIKKLNEAGITTQVGVLEEQARQLNVGFIKRMEKKLPIVRCKLAMSFDARTAMASGESRWITSVAARQDVQRWRACSDAIITGIDTILLDNPSLTVRANEMAAEDVKLAPAQQPLRVVLDSHLRTPITAKIFKQPGQTAIVYATHNETTEYALETSGAELKYFPSADSHVDLAATVKWLAEEKECNEVWIEAGATLSGAFIQAGLVDELIVYMAPKLLGDSARPLLHLPGMQTVSQHIPLNIKEVKAVGEDWRFLIDLKKA